MAKKDNIIKAGAGLLFLWMLMPSTTTAATGNNNGSTGGIPMGGIAPGAPPGDMNESFLGTDNYPGIANNNLGNIKFTLERLNDPWQGSIDWENNTDGTFEQFKRLADGTRALIKLLRNYIDTLGRNTPKIIIKWWNVGNPDYLSFLVNRTGFGENQVLTSNKATLKALAQAIARFENGQEILTDQRFENGWSLL